MSGERNFFKESHNGNLVVREFDIQGNVIIGYYDVKNSNLVFVLDCLINSLKPNVLLIINPDGNRKWDEIISNTYNANLETIRPKQDNKYQKLDIEYSGLSVYDNLITAFVNNEDLTVQLQELNIVRNSAIRHSALSRLTTANEIITKTNTTILKTKENIEKTQSTLKQLKNKLVLEKQSIGKKPTKQSAAKILRIESQIEATELKLHKAKKRLVNAQKRLDIATAESDQATLLLNAQSDIKQTDPAELQKSFNVDHDEETDIQPLFKEDPHILDENNAFKPVSFNTQQTDLSESVTEEDSFVFESSSTKETKEQNTEDSFSFTVPNLNQLSSMLEETNQNEQKTNTNDVQKPILETLNEPNLEDSNNIVFDKTNNTSLPPVLDSITPIITKEDIKEPIIEEKTLPVIENVSKETMVQQTPSIKEHQKKNTIVYYVLLTILIVLSIFTLLLYQKHIANDTLPILAAKTPTVSTKTVTVEESNKVDVLPTDTTNVIIESDSTSVNMNVSENDSSTDEDSNNDFVEISSDIIEEPNTPQEDKNIIEAPNDQQNLESDLVAEEASIESSPTIEKPIYNVSVDSVSDDNVFLDDFSNEEYYEE